MGCCMDTQQFPAFLKSQRNFMAQLSQRTVGATYLNTVQSSSNNIINTALVPNFNLFEPEKETERNQLALSILIRQQRWRHQN
uniref:Uncharacterized protein n=1 Tax=Glossina palpalis gambiensis TaxID=67801 RepID=A0A1B0C2I9_9MUSC